MSTARTLAVAREPSDTTPPADDTPEDLDDLNRRIADEAAEATTADKRNPKS